MPPKRKMTKTEESKDLAPVKRSKKVIEPSTRILRNPKVAAVKDLKKATIKPAKKPKVEANGDADISKRKPSAKASTGTGKKAQQTKKGPSAKPSEPDVAEDENAENDATSIYDFTANNINGESVPLEKYKGYVCIIVNVASRCGHTASNYKEFVEIYDKYNKEKGLKILAFPCNQFGKQEPGDNAKICEFAKKRNVQFDMFEKIEVNGKNAHPLWKYLTSQKAGPKGPRIEWNFTKFLINKDGQVVDRFKSSVKPTALIAELEKLW